MLCTAHRVGELKGYRYVVTFARQKGRWSVCRHRARETWEASGGHIEPGETPLQAAQRELFEETGATEAEILAVCDYWASDEPHERNPGTWSNGRVFLADVAAIGELPEGFEMAEIGRFDRLPERVTYPDIYRVLFPLAAQAANGSVRQANGESAPRGSAPWFEM